MPRQTAPRNAPSEAGGDVPRDGCRSSMVSVSGAGALGGLLKKMLEGDDHERRDQHGLVLPFRGFRVHPVTLGVLQLQELLAKVSRQLCGLFFASTMMGSPYACKAFAKTM